LSEFRKLITLACGLSPDSDDETIATKLAEMLSAKRADASLPENAKKFDELVGEAITTKQLDYSQAASLVSREHPELYLAHREASFLN
jgi:flagellar motor switch protein FliG